MSRSKTFMCGIAFAVITGGATAAVWGQQQQPRDDRSQDPNLRDDRNQDPNIRDDRTQDSQLRLRTQKASDLIGKPVKNPEGERLGEVQDLAIDPDRGQVVYAVLSFGGFMGMGEKWFAVPATAFTLPSHAENFVLAVDKDRLKNATGFDKGNWPNMGDATWSTQIHDFYNQKPYWSSTNGTPDKPLRIQKASDLIGKKVVNTQGENLGEVHDLAIDPDRERIAYTVLSFGGFMNMGEKWFAIPWSSFTLPTDARHLTLQVDKQQLQASDGFDKDRWPDMSNVQWASGTYQRYGQKPFWLDGCPGCGMNKTAWSGSGAGHEASGVAYCCRSCADGAGCTCLALSRSR